MINKNYFTNGKVDNDHISLNLKGTHIFRFKKNTVCVKKTTGIIELDNKWNFPDINADFLCDFLGVTSKQDIINNIENGTYRLKPLNFI